ncbi:MAG TPA: hypothetical protein VFG65_05700 [Fimbriimonadales bacterium]|jgi:hypothetical protein|nr:hypothetical protein [Fimbriimonadales bacterium]
MALTTAGLALSAVVARADQVWEAKSGTTSFSLFKQVVQDLGLNLRVDETAVPQGDMEEAVGFKMTSGTNLKFFTSHGNYRYWVEGRVTNSGGFTLSGPKGSVSLKDFSIVYRNTGVSDNMFILADSSEDSPVLFDMSHIKVNFDRDQKVLRFGYADVIITNRAANQLGRPDLAGQIIGMVTVSALADFVSGDTKDPALPPPPTDQGGMNGNVELHNLGDCASYGRVGTYPNGISGLGVSTTSCNVTNIPGDTVNWYQQMDERHPVIAQNFYRVHTVNGGTRLEQIGIGWVKHGFLSTNSNGCIGPHGETCVSPPEGGRKLGVRCSDTYGSSLNADRNWLGPRNEVNPFTGRWECTNSYFSGFQPDCISRFNTNGLDGVAHRLQVADQDLLAADSTFSYEAYYVSENDVDRFNNLAWRPCTVSWSGSHWNFSPTQGQTQGPRVETWGDVTPAPRAQPESEGFFLVGVEVTSLGGGMYHYEYAGYNHTSQREARAFRVPLPAGAVVQNIGFHDVDSDPSNDWRSTVDSQGITFSTDTYESNPDANSLKWYTLYNFRFDTNVAPVNTYATLGLFRPGVQQTLTVLTRGPNTGLTLPGSMSIDRGQAASGELSDLYDSNNSRLNVRPGAVFSTNENPISVVLEGTSPDATPTSFKFHVESSGSTTNIRQVVALYNFSTSQWVTLSTTTMGTSDGVVEVTASNPSQFLEPGTLKVRARLEYKATSPTFVYPYFAQVDQAVWKILP